MAVEKKKYFKVSHILFAIFYELFKSFEVLCEDQTKNVVDRHWKSYVKA